MEYLEKEGPVSRIERRGDAGGLDHKIGFTLQYNQYLRPAQSYINHSAVALSDHNCGKKNNFSLHKNY